MRTDEIVTYSYPYKVDTRTFKKRGDVDENPHKQTVAVDLVMKKSTYTTTAKYEGRDKDITLLAIDLLGSKVSATHGGTIGVDANDGCGYYLENAIVTMTPSEPTKLTLIKDTPTTQQLSGAISNSHTVNLGTFGDTPTANVTFGSSNTVNIQDIFITNNSTDTNVKHTYALNMTAEGDKYTGPKSLINEWQSPFVGARLKGVPPIAKSDMPLDDLGIWLVHDDASHDTLAIDVKVTFNLSGITEEFYGLCSENQYYQTDVWAHQELIFNLGKLKKPEPNLERAQPSLLSSSATLFASSIERQARSGHGHSVSGPTLLRRFKLPEAESAESESGKSSEPEAIRLTPDHP
jgi:hypothetical protein